MSIEYLLDNQGVEVSDGAQLGQGSRLQVLFLVNSSDGVLVTENKVDLVGASAFVGSKHDGVGGFVGELLELDALGRICEELHVGTTALQSGLSLDLIPVEIYELISVRLVHLLLLQLQGLTCWPASLCDGNDTYWTTRVLSLLSTTSGKEAEMAWWAAGLLATKPLSPFIPG